MDKHLHAGKSTVRIKRKNPRMYTQRNPHESPHHAGASKMSVSVVGALRLTRSARAGAFRRTPTHCDPTPGKIAALVVRKL